MTELVAHIKWPSYGKNITMICVTVKGSTFTVGNVDNEAAVVIPQEVHNAFMEPGDKCINACVMDKITAEQLKLICCTSAFH